MTLLHSAVNLTCLSPSLIVFRCNSLSRPLRLTLPIPPSFAPHSQPLFSREFIASCRSETHLRSHAVSPFCNSFGFRRRATWFCGLMWPKVTCPFFPTSNNFILFSCSNATTRQFFSGTGKTYPAILVRSTLVQVCRCAKDLQSLRHTPCEPSKSIHGFAASRPVRKSCRCVRTPNEDLETVSFSRFEKAEGLLQRYGFSLFSIVCNLQSGFMPNDITRVSSL